MLKLRFWLVLAAAMVALVAPTAAQADANVVPNPGFEIAGCSNNPNGTETTICRWPDSLVGRISMLRDTSNPHSGEASMNLGCAGLSCEGVSFSAHSICTPIAEGTHPASFWYRSVASGNPLDVNLFAVSYVSPDCSGSANFDPRIGDPEAFTDGAWHEVTGNLVLPVNTRSVVFFLHVRMCEWCALPVWFDDLDVQAAGLAPMPASAALHGGD
jgi:hypothetical protein